MATEQVSAATFSSVAMPPTFNPVNAVTALTTLVTFLTLGGVFEKLSRDPSQLSTTYVKQEDCYKHVFSKATAKENIFEDEQYGQVFLPDEVSLFLTLLFPLVPVPFYFVNGDNSWGLSTAKEKIFSPPLSHILFSHVLGQSGSYATAEINKYFIIAPDKNFRSACNVSGDVCTEMTNENANVSIKILCAAGVNEAATALAVNVLSANEHGLLMDGVSLLQHLHTVPNVQSALLGAGTVVFVLLAYHSHLFLRSMSFLIKIGLILFFILSVHFLLWNQHFNHGTSIPELFFSFVVGLLVQTAICLMIQKVESKPGSLQPFTIATSTSTTSSCLPSKLMPQSFANCQDNVSASDNKNENDVSSFLSVTQSSENPSSVSAPSLSNSNSIHKNGKNAIRQSKSKKSRTKSTQTLANDSLAAVWIPLASLASNKAKPK